MYSNLFICLEFDNLEFNLLFFPSNLTKRKQSEAIGKQAQLVVAVYFTIQLTKEM
jgi:hypothetical protein